MLSSFNEATAPMTQSTKMRIKTIFHPTPVLSDDFMLVVQGWLHA